MEERNSEVSYPEGRFRPRNAIVQRHLALRRISGAIPELTFSRGRATQPGATTVALTCNKMPPRPHTNGGAAAKNRDEPVRPDQLSLVLGKSVGGAPDGTSATEYW